MADLSGRKLPGNAAVDFSLYLITDRHQAGSRGLTDVVRAALAGGVRAVQLREKGLPDPELFELAKSLRNLTNQYGAWLLINQRPDICLAVGADGVHLGAGGIAVSEVRRLYGGRLLIGYSAHALDEVCRAAKDGADFVTFGPVYHTPSKAPYGEPLGVSCLKEVCRSVDLPVFALGGIKQANVPEVMTAGAAGIAVISAVIAGDDPMKEAINLLKTIEGYANHS